MMDTATAHTAILNVARRRHPRLAFAVEQNGVIGLRSARDDCIVKFLAGTVISQQLSTKAAQTIWNRVCELSDELDEPLEKMLDNRNSDRLSECGVSRAKVKALTEMAKCCRDGVICGTRIRNSSFEEIVSEVTSLWGFGSWSADMAAMFFAKLPNVWPISDVALIRGLQSLAPGEDPNDAARQYSPHRTYLARHIWKAIDTGLATGR